MTLKLFADGAFSSGESPSRGAMDSTDGDPGVGGMKEDESGAEGFPGEFSFFSMMDGAPGEEWLDQRLEIRRRMNSIERSGSGICPGERRE